MYFIVITCWHILTVIPTVIMSACNVCNHSLQTSKIMDIKLETIVWKYKSAIYFYKDMPFYKDKCNKDVQNKIWDIP